MQSARNGSTSKQFCLQHKQIIKVSWLLTRVTDITWTIASAKLSTWGMQDHHRSFLRHFLIGVKCHFFPFFCRCCEECCQYLTLYLSIANILSVQALPMSYQSAPFKRTFLAHDKCIWPLGLLQKADEAFCLLLLNLPQYQGYQGCKISHFCTQIHNVYQEIVTVRLEMKGQADS